MNEPSVVGIILVSALVVLLGLALGAVLIGLRRTRRELDTTRNETDELHARLDLLVERIDAPDAHPAPPLDVAEQEFVITELGRPEPEPVAERIQGRLFADIVLRETVVKAASLTHGLRRALSPESRNRIRFEMKREVKRSRKQRRADTKIAVREWEARQRAQFDAGDAA